MVVVGVAVGTADVTFVVTIEVAVWVTVVCVTAEVAGAGGIFTLM